MADGSFDFETSLKDMSRQEWIDQVEALTLDHGYVTPLGARHTAVHVENGETLLVSFETHNSIQSLSPEGRPLGWEMVQDHDWSHLAIISDGDTWFRDAAVYGFFDRLSDGGFFDGFKSVLFYGAGPCGYAAAAFSVAAPGSRVLALHPQATLDPRIAGWDKRFVQMRRMDFSDRYGYAPDMLDGAMAAYVIFDPFEPLDAMHAALFTHPAVTKLRLPHMGGALQKDVLAMKLLPALMLAAAEGQLTPERFAILSRARRNHMPYLRRLLKRLDDAGREKLAIALCQNVLNRRRAPRFAKRLQQLNVSPES